MTDYPEHAKLERLAAERIMITEFTAWLADQGVHLVRSDAAGNSQPVTVADGLVAKFLGIDATVLEAERRQMFDALYDLTETAA
jgi:hypothetical protein